MYHVKQRRRMRRTSSSSSPVLRERLRACLGGRRNVKAELSVHSLQSPTPLPNSQFKVTVAKITQHARNGQQESHREERAEGKHFSSIPWIGLDQQLNFAG
jgi:hypothetical protein